MKDYKLEIKDNEINNKNCELILNNNKLIFVQNIFRKEGKYELKIIFKSLIKNISFMFSQCTS